MKKFILIILAICVLNVSFVQAAQNEKKGLGFKGFRSSVSKLPKSKMQEMKSLPALIDWSNKLPAVGSQGHQGSCVAWALGYYYKSFQEQKDWHWSIDSNTYSPAFIYNSLNGGEDNGLYLDDAFNFVQNFGACKMSYMPYDQDDYNTLPSERAMSNALNYKAKTMYSLDPGNVDTLKNWVASGDCAVIGIPVSADFDWLDSSNPVYDIFDEATYRGYHALCVCGYDDSKQAFLFVNSWGPEWGISGYGYIAYDLYNEFRTQTVVMTDNNDGHKVTFRSMTKTANVGQGSDWSYSITTGSGSTITKGKYVYTKSNQVKIRIVEDDGPTTEDDIYSVTKILKPGVNNFDCKVYENKNTSKYAVWRITINYEE